MKKNIFIVNIFLSVFILNCSNSSNKSIPVNWKEYSTNPIIDSEWDTTYDLLINDPCVIKENGTYRMWLSQGTGLGINHVRIYQGTSFDGINWTLDRSTILLEPNSDATATGTPNPDVTGTYKLTGELVADLVNNKSAFKHATQNWYLWYDSSAANYRISGASGIAGAGGWLGNGGTKVDGTYTPYGTSTGTITIASDWDSEKIETPMVIKVGTTYHMYYSGLKIGDAPRYQIGHATSPDGTTWTKDLANNPVVSNHDIPQNWGYFLVAEPAVIYNNNTFYLYYSSLKYRGIPAYDGTEFQNIQGICLATSTNGSVFTFQHSVLTQSTNYPVSEKYVGYSTPFVMKDSKNKYHLFYDVAEYLTPSDWRQVALAHAVSDDGLNFTEIEHDIFVYGQGDWKDYEVRSPSVLEEGGYFKMWFAGNNSLFFQPGFIWGIGYATLRIE